MLKQYYYNQNEFKTLNNEEWELPKGFTSAFIANTGTGNAILIDYKGGQLILAPDESIGYEDNGHPYYQVKINAMGTVVKIGFVLKVE